MHLYQAGVPLPTPQKSMELSELQKELILQAADMLRPGGLMLYSTCTFAPAEDEQTVSWLLENRPDMELAEMEDYEGFSHGVLRQCTRKRKQTGSIPGI